MPKSATEWIVEIQATGDSNKTVIMSDQFTLDGDTITFTGWTGLSDTEYTLTLLANSLKRSNGKMNAEYKITFKTKYVVPVNYILYSKVLGASTAAAITVQNADTRATVETIAINDWAAIEQYLPNVVKIIDNGMFQAWKGNPDYDFDLPKCTEIGNSFLNYATDFNRAIRLPLVESIGDLFLSNCTAFNQPIYIPEVTKIGRNFLSYCTNFNQPVSLLKCTNTSYSFLTGCTNFNQPVELPIVKQVGNGFISYCPKFNQPVDVSNLEGSIADTFLGGCNSFNSPVTLSPTITSIGNSFLAGNPVFNQPIDLKNVTSVGAYFLQACPNFNQDLDLSKLTTIGTNFLYNNPRIVVNYDSVITVNIQMTPYYFLYNVGSNTNGKNPTLILTATQTITELNSSILNQSASINLVLPGDSNGIDLSDPVHPKWFGRWFNSITLT